MKELGQSHKLSHALHTDDPVALGFLMSDTLFDLDESEPLQVETKGTIVGEIKSSELGFFGGNRSGLLFITSFSSEPTQHRLPSAEMEAFEKILDALKLKVDDIALINIAAEQPEFSALLSYFNPEKVVVLGTSLRLKGLGDLDVQPTLHQVHTQDKLSILHSYSFSEMMDDVDKKRVFWSNLKLLIG